MEGAPLYDSEGKVNDPEIAHEGALKEDKYHKRGFKGLLQAIGSGLTKKERAEFGNRKAELAMENGVTIERSSLPKVVETELALHQKQAEMGLEDGDFEIEAMTKADLGAGVERYRIHMSVDSIGVDVGMTSAPRSAGLTVEGEANEIELIVDVKDGVIVHKEIKEIPSTFMS